MILSERQNLSRRHGELLFRGERAVWPRERHWQFPEIDDGFRLVRRYRFAFGCDRDLSLRARLWTSLFSVSPCLRGGLVSRQFQATPQIPRRITAIGVPAPGDLFHLLWRWHLPLPVSPLDGHAHAKVADR